MDKKDAQKGQNYDKYINTGNITNTSSINNAIEIGVPEEDDSGEVILKWKTKDEILSDTSGNKDYFIKIQPYDIQQFLIEGEEEFLNE